MILYNDFVYHNNVKLKEIVRFKYQIGLPS